MRIIKAKERSTTSDYIYSSEGVFGFRKLKFIQNSLLLLANCSWPLLCPVLGPVCYSPFWFSMDCWKLTQGQKNHWLPVDGPLFCSLPAWFSPAGSFMKAMHHFFQQQKSFKTIKRQLVSLNKTSYDKLVMEQAIVMHPSIAWTSPSGNMNIHGEHGTNVRYEVSSNSVRRRHRIRHIYYSVLNLYFVQYMVRFGELWDTVHLYTVDALHHKWTI